MAQQALAPGVRRYLTPLMTPCIEARYAYKRSGEGGAVLSRLLLKGR